MSEKDSTENRQGQGNLPRTYHQTWRWRTDYQKIFGNPDKQFEHRVQRALDYLEQRKAVTKLQALTLVRKEEENSIPSRPAPLSEAALSNWRVDYRTTPLSTPDADSSRPGLKALNAMGYRKWRAAYLGVFGGMDKHFDRRLEQARLLLDQGQATDGFQALSQVRWMEQGTTSSRPSQDEAVQAPGTEADRIGRLEAEVAKLEQDVRALYIWKHWAATRLTHLADMYSNVRKPMCEPPRDWTDQTHLLLVEIRERLQKLEQAVEAAVRRV